MFATPTLRIRQQTPVDSFYPIHLTLKRPNQPDIEAEANIAFALSDQEQAELRWYMEDYLDRAETVEAIQVEQIEKMMRQRGEELYSKVLAANHNTQALWFAVREQLADLRIEISSTVTEAAAIPWELMRDPQSDSALAVRVQAFVRVQSNPNTGFVPVPQATDGRIRLLYVICRPNGINDVGLRTIANRLLQGLGEQRPRFDITALRPPTYEQLQKTLTNAKRAGQPYHIVHFDGHGMYADLSETKLTVWLNQLSASKFSNKTNGKHGYLLFEHPDSAENVRPVSGEELGKLLHDSGVPVLVLNACQSAMHEATTPYRPSGQDWSEGDPSNVHDEIRAIGSLAQAVVDQGIPAVLGMRYSVFVVTAAQYIGELYAALAKGCSFGQAASEARKHLSNNPDRWLGLSPRQLPDWIVPVVYEAIPFYLLTQTLSLPLIQQPELDPAQSNPQLRHLVPDQGFIGRDEILLMLDRAFDNHPIVLLHAYAGQGKTSAAVEFSRWYAQTGGLGDKPIVLFKSFEFRADLADVLNHLGHIFTPMLQAHGIEWHTLNELDQRRNLVLQLLRQQPVLWIWDNVEPITGFPESTESAWSQAEQAELADFLKQIKLDKSSKVKLLLTSRHEEQRWLGGIPLRVKMPRMSHADAAALILALGQEKGLIRSEIAAWQPLLAYCAGNPLTLRVIAGQAVNMGLRGQKQIAAFIDAVRDGEQRIVDAAEGRDRSLGASLEYGFRHAFTMEELPIIALLHCFQGLVDVHALELMGQGEYALPELQNIDKNRLVGLLKRAGNIGLLTPILDTLYGIHPTLPWFLRQLFEQHYDGQTGRSSTEAVLHVWSEVIGSLGIHYHVGFNEGNRQVTILLQLEEANLLYTRRLAIRHGWWNPVIAATQGLRTLYQYQGRMAEWIKLVVEITPIFCTEDDTPIPGREDGYGVVMHYRVDLARKQEHNFAHAATLQEKALIWDRLKATDALALPNDQSLDTFQRDLIRNVGVGLLTLGQIQSEQNNNDCMKYYQEAIRHFKRINDIAAESVVHFNIGHAYKDLPAIINLNAAEMAYWRSMELMEQNDFFARSKCFTQIGAVHQKRLHEARQHGKPKEILIFHFQKAEMYYQEALKLRPASAAASLGPLYAMLGDLYAEIDQPEHACEYYLKAVQISEQADNLHDAGKSRYSLAVMYARLSDQTNTPIRRNDLLRRARAYAEAALRDFSHYPGRAVDMEAQTQQLIEDIDQALSAIGPSA